MMTVLMAVFLCVYYGFSLHDKAVLEEASWQVAQKTMLLITENSNFENGFFDWEALQEKELSWRLSKSAVNTEKIGQYLQEQIAGELLACDLPTFQMESTSGSVRIQYQARIRLPLFSTLRLFGFSSELSGQVKVQESEQEELIRLVRGIVKDEDNQAEETDDESIKDSITS